MTTAVSRPRGFLSRNTRPMPDGRLLLRSGHSFAIMEAEELSRLERWLMVSIAIDLVGIVVIVVAFLLSEQGTIREDDMWTILWIAGGIMILSLLTIGPMYLLAIRMRTQPAEDHDRLKDIWNRGGPPFVEDGPATLRSSRRIRLSMFRNARPMADGRRLVWSGADFYILEAGELHWQKYARPILILVQACILIAIIIGVIYRFQKNPVEDVLWLATLPLLAVSAVLSFAVLHLNRRLERRRQPDSDRDRLLDIWNKIG